MPKPGRVVSVAAALALATLACSGPTAVDDADVCLAGEPSHLSFLVAGDTGDRLEWLPWLDQHREVGAVLAAEHRRRPAAGLMLLGDNFYSEGLEPHEAVDRIRDNLVLPFCTFVSLDGPRSAEVADACPVPEQERAPIPIYAVLGNHDYNTPESPRLQRELVPQFVTNWEMPPGQAEVVELPQGVSLLVLDSEQLERGGDPGPLKEALAESRGPWRILVGHHPIGQGDVGFKRGLTTAMEATGVPVQLLMAGHEHLLGIATNEPPLPAMTLISGAGSRLREPRYGVMNPQQWVVAPGFARVDLVGEGEDGRLVVSLVATPKHALDFWSPTRVVGCWSVDVAGRVEGGARP